MKKCVLLVFLAGASIAIGATDVPAPQVLVPGDGASGDQYGLNVAVSGKTLVVSSPMHTHDLLDGAIYVYEERGSSWVLVKELVPDDIPPTNNFGSAPGSVAIDDPHIVVGDTHSEAAYAFRKIDGEWQYTQKIPNPKGIDNNFGDAVALSGNRLAVSYPFPGNGGIVFYDFDGSSWQYVDEICPPALEGDRLGESLSMSGDVLVAGVPNYVGWWGTGGVAVFIRSGGTWFYDDTLIVDGIDNMGWDVAISEDLTIVASSDEEFTGYGAGAVYVWEREAGDWVLAAHLHPQNVEYWESFGPYLAIHGDTILVGKHGDDYWAQNAGAVYVFKKGARWWSLDTIVDPPVFQVDQRFGQSVAASGEIWAVGAPHVGGSTTGETYVYDFLPSEIFADGFESGDTTAWSTTVP